MSSSERRAVSQWHGVVRPPTTAPLTDHNDGDAVMNFTRAATRPCLLLLMVIGLAGCDEDLLSEDPPDIIVADNLYTDLAGFRAALSALYAQVRREREGANGANELMNEPWTVGVDNAFSNYPSGVERIWNEWGVRNEPQTGFYLDVWTWLYRTINAANTIITRAENPDVDWTEDEKNEVLAEAYLFRAWAYRHLTYLWGDVPLNLVESTGESIRTDWERTPVPEVRAQIEQDLLFAKQYLPEVRPSPGRLSRAVAQHYLAELYLVLDRPADAEAEAAAIIDTELYQLVTERYGAQAGEPGVAFMDPFIDANVNSSPEALWTLQLEVDAVGGGGSIMRRYWVNRYYNLDGVEVSAEYGGRGIGRLSPTRWAIELYEPQDDRGSHFAIRKFYLYNEPSNLPPGKQLGDTLHLSWDEEAETNPFWPSTRKWDWSDPEDPSGARQQGDQPYIRLAETYLLLAEALYEQDRLAEAAQAINVVRERANATPITAAQVTLDFILDERSRELLTEEQRRYTLVRTGTWLERTRLHNPLAAPNITDRDVLFPIPQAVIDANLGAPMPQNPGY